MRPHVIEIGPHFVRRLCCGGAAVADLDVQRSVFECIDDPVALIDLRPVTVASLWQDMIESIHCGVREELIVIHPSWWSATRVDVVAAAVPDGAELRPRSWLCAQAAPSGASTMEITADFVVTTGPEVLVETRRRNRPEPVEAVVNSVLATDTNAVVIDAPASVRGAGTLAAAIAKRLPGVVVVVVDDLRFRRLAGELGSTVEHPAPRRRRLLAPLVLMAATPLGAGVLHHRAQPQPHPYFPTTFAVESHVAVEVPADWPMKRVIAGPGSARLQYTSPTDAEVALHVTQSRVALPGLDATADFLRRAIDEAPERVFVDFNPVDRGGGRAVVTYREVRAHHDIRWTVWVDKAVRISIGCQSRSGRSEAIAEVCDLAVRSARALE